MTTIVLFLKLVKYIRYVSNDTLHYGINFFSKKKRVKMQKHYLKNSLILLHLKE